MKEKPKAHTITQEDRSCLEALDAALRSQTLRAQIRLIVERVRTELARQTEELMTWEPIPLSAFRRALPPGIRSAWVFILRAGADTGAERHPNSHQRMMSFEGSGDLQTGEPARWQSNILISDPAAPLEQRWISIPPNVWHRPVIGRNADWTVVSFHTVPAEELIEERPDTSSIAGTKQMKYMNESRKEEGRRRNMFSKARGCQIAKLIRKPGRPEQLLNSALFLLTFLFDRFGK